MVKEMKLEAISNGAVEVLNDISSKEVKSLLESVSYILSSVS